MVPPPAAALAVTETDAATGAGPEELDPPHAVDVTATAISAMTPPVLHLPQRSLAVVIR